MVSQLTSKVLHTGIVLGLFAGIVWLGLGMPAGGAQASTWNPDFVSGTPDPYPRAAYGSALAAAGGEVIAGAPGAGTDQPGEAYVLDATTGALLHTLQNPTPSAGDEFGAAVAIGSNRYLVGAPDGDTVDANTGAVYVYDGTGAFLGTILDEAASQGDRFGASVAVIPGGGGLFAIGAPGTPGTLNSIGKAYLYDGQTTDFLTIQNPTPELGDHFGSVVGAFPGDFSRVVVGAPGDNRLEGAVHVFDTRRGALVQTFGSPDPYPRANFGAAIAGTDDGKLLVGAPYDEVDGVILAGAAYLFEASTGAHEATFENPAPAAGDRFGDALTGVKKNGAGNPDGDFIIGAPGDDTAGNQAGAVYLADAGASNVFTTFNPDLAPGDQFGWAVAWGLDLSPSGGQWIVVGAPGADDASGDADAGALHGFCLDWDEDGVCDGDDPDDDADQCPDANEQQTDPGSELSGGRRSSRNHWDYFNPTHDGQNRIDDIIKVVEQFFVDSGNPDYTAETDRTLLGPNDWNLGPPNGQQRVNDIIHAVDQFFHDCP